ncbi:MAG: matrixin family metalloprotease [Chloroflexota bacterium]
MSDGDEILETDIVFNKSMRWGIDADGEGTAFKLKNTYDVDNIGTHEVGHVVGLDDIYDTIYSEITMYGYSSKAETKKISLEIGDKNGTAILYDPKI